MNYPKVSKLFIYPVKSLDPVELTTAEIGIHSLKHDRTFAMKTSDDRFVNSKRTGRVNQLKTSYDLEAGIISLGERNSAQSETFELRTENEKLNAFLSDFFDLEIHLVQSEKGELQDVPFRSSATVISTATYQSLLQDFPEHTLEDFRLRFRANIEIEDIEAFGEEKLLPSPHQGTRFTIGDIELIAMSPRDRCNVPPRNPLTGETDKTFVKKMIDSRAKSLPKNSIIESMRNTYFLAIDTYLPPTQFGKKISVGDELQKGETIDLSSFE